VNNDIQAFAKTNNCMIGICDASPIDPTHLQKSKHVPFVSSNLRKRTDPSAILPGVQSIVVFGVKAEQACPPQEHSTKNLAQLSSLGTDTDYHASVKTLIDKFVAEVVGYIQNFKYKTLIDSPNLDERAFAYRAGLGFFGCNGLLISPGFGTRFNIGLLLTNVPLEHFGCKNDGSLGITAQACPPNCNLCITACPTNALQLNAPLNTACCISYLTQKKDLTTKEELLLSQHNQLYGCDICQDACPFNTPYEKTYINPQQWLEADDATFAKKYNHTAMLWQGAALLRRNAELIIRNN